MAQKAVKDRTQILAVEKEALNKLVPPISIKKAAMKIHNLPDVKVAIAVVLESGK